MKPHRTIRKLRSKAIFLPDKGEGEAEVSEGEGEDDIVLSVIAIVPKFL